MVKGIFHAGVSTRDMEESLRFYCDVLGGTRIMEIEEPKGCLLYTSASSTSSSTTAKRSASTISPT